MVSICCTTYNHEKYIRDALDGFLMQKTSFKFEVLIHDDASTDGTADIIREYEEQYPDIIKPIYQTVNQYSKSVPITKTYQIPRASGKYIAMCEGDDFWTDEYKLQKQFDALEHNPECVMCTHIVMDVDENGKQLETARPKPELADKIFNNIISSKELFDNIFIDNIIPFQTSSFFVKKSVMESYYHNPPSFSIGKGFGDVPLLWYSITQGSVYFIPEVMSNYRKDCPGGWTVRTYASKDYLVKHFQRLLGMVQEYNFYTHNQFESSIMKICAQIEFQLYNAQGKYRKLFKKKYSDMWKKKNLKEKLYIIIFAIFPDGERIYLKLKDR